MVDKKTYGKSERTRRFIIEQVAPVFNKKGYSGTSLSDLTQATGLTKGAIYGHFKNKDEIATEAFKHNVGIIAGTLTTELSMREGAIDKLSAITKVFKKMYPKLISIGGCPILNTATDADDSHPALKELSKRMLMNYKTTIESIISAGIKNKEIKADTNPDAVAGLILTLLEGGILIAKTMDNNDYFNTALKQIKSIIKQLKR